MFSEKGHWKALLEYDELSPVFMRIDSGLEICSVYMRSVRNVLCKLKSIASLLRVTDTMQ